MTTPNKQPTPPPGYRLLTEEDYGKPTPEGTIFWNAYSQQWNKRAMNSLDSCPAYIYAIPSHPATGDAVGFIPKKERERLNKVIRNISEHAKPVEQRQELPIPEAYYSCGGSCREDRSLPADDLAWFPKVKLWLCCECSEDKEEVGDAEITLEDYLKTRK